MKPFKALLRHHRSSKGEIATTLTLIALFTMMLGSLAGIRSSQDIRNRAAGSCSYYSTASVVKTDGSPVRTSDNGNKAMTIKNDLNYRDRLDSNGTFSFGTRTFNFGAYKKPSTTATVTLENLDTTLWKVTSTFCTQKPGSSVGCDLGAKGVGPTKLTMQYFHVNCGVDIAYGWVVEPLMGNPATPTPTPRSVQTFPTGFANPRLPQDRITPTTSIFSTPTPTLSLSRAFCNVRCDLESGNTCATGFICANTCAQGEYGCAPSNRGVCRAVSCPSDTSCGCGKPLIPTTVPFQPTIKPTIQPTAVPTVAPLALPCFYDSKLSVVDTSGKNLSVTALEGRQNQWSVVNGTGGTVQFDTHYGSTTPFRWGFDTVAPNKKIDGLMQTSAFIPVYTPNPNTPTTSLTLRMDPTYEVVQKKILKHCQQEFDRLNGVVRGCSNVDNKAQLNGDYLGVVTAGAPNEIPNVALLCNMRVDAQYVVRKKPTGTARVNVQLSAGDDLSRNIPFTTEQVTPGKHLYAGQSTVTFTGNSSSNAGYTKTVAITQPTVDTALPIGGYAVSYNFPAGVLPVREGNDGYRLNSPPIDGTQITISEGNVYTYRVIYNMNTYYCKGTRNKTSCESCNGGYTDQVINDAWPNPKGKVLCCPTNKGDKKPGDFSCPNNHDSRCTAGSTYYGNCGHTDPASGTVCPQGQRAKYICQTGNPDNYWNYLGCVASPSNMERCVAPTPTSVPRPTAGSRAPGVPTPTSPFPTPTLPYPIECENPGLFTRPGQTTRSDSPSPKPGECPNSFIGGKVTFINPHNLPLDGAKIEIHFREFDTTRDRYLETRSKKLKNMKNGANSFRIYGDNNNIALKSGVKYEIVATTLVFEISDKYYMKTRIGVGLPETSMLPYNDVNHILDLSDWADGRGHLGGTLNIINPNNVPLDVSKITFGYADEEGEVFDKTLKGLNNGLNGFQVFEDDKGRAIPLGKTYPWLTMHLSFDHDTYTKTAENLGPKSVVSPDDSMKFTLDLSDASVGFLKGTYVIHNKQGGDSRLARAKVIIDYQADYGGKKQYEKNVGVPYIKPTNGNNKFIILESDSGDVIQGAKSYKLGKARLYLPDENLTFEDSSNDGRVVPGNTSNLIYEFDLINPANGGSQPNPSLFQRLKQNILDGWELVISAFN